MKLVPTTLFALSALAVACSDAEVSDKQSEVAPQDAADTASTSASDASSAETSNLPGAAAGASASAAPATAVVHASDASTASTPTALELPPLEEGFQRYIAPPVEVEPGVSDDWIHWVGGPTDQDFDVVEVKGAQSKGGHHALMLSIRDANPMGFTRKYTERDQLTSSSLGGIGAEGAVPIPEGVVFRVKKGTYFAIQTHYLNPTDALMVGETYVDIKLTPVDTANTVATHFASTSLAISLAPHAQTTLDLNCMVEQDLQVLRMTNHMHHYGLSTFTELTDPAGVTTMLKQDDTWSEDWALTPNYDNFTVASPLLIPKGSNLHTHCLWNNESDKEVTFPTEMCVFATVILGENDISCIDGKFNVSNTEQQQTSAPTTPAAGSDAQASAPTGSGACTGAEDSAVLAASEFVDAQRTCGAMCLGDTEMCTTACLTKNTSLSAECAACNGAYISCAMSHCLADCSGGFMSPRCMPCAEAQCGEPYHACSGL